MLSSIYRFFRVQPINSVIQLLKTFFNIFLGFLALFAAIVFVNKQVVRTLMPVIANSFYNVLAWAIDVVALLCVLVLFIILVLNVISYMQNRGKPDKPSPEVQAINELSSKVQLLIDLASRHELD
jgi:hypothetical protein